MKKKPFKDINTWKRHEVVVELLNEENNELVTPTNFRDLKNLKKVSIVIKFDGEQVYQSKKGVLGVREHNYQVLERKGFLFKTVKKTIDTLCWKDTIENDIFIKWCNHFRISDQIQYAVKLKLIEVYCEEVETVRVDKPEILKYIEL